VRYRVLAIGRRADDPLIAVAQSYLERLTRYVPSELVRLRDSDIAGERDDLLRALKPDEWVVALDERGRERTTIELAELLGRWQRDAVRGVAFVIGGADGLHADVKTRARETWSLSRLTLPHRLALVVLLEQLYRAQTVLRGEPYHRS
jgi:23S rRNA (pseudouridine1915-N3)-methyltransferase